MILSVVVISYNTKELTKQTLQSIFDKKIYNYTYEVIVVDNASTDGSIEMLKKEFPQVKLILSDKNLGFSKGNNLAIKQSQGQYILLLNSDTVIIDDCLEKSIRYMEKHKSVGALGCKVLLSNGELDHACKRGFPTPEASLYYMLKMDKLFPESTKFGQYTLNYLSQDEINEVDSVTGAFMMVRREAFDQVGLLDEDFFMYGEDIDWCYRIKTAGWKIIYFPESKIIHYKGGSSKKKRWKVMYEFHRAMYLFYHKHYAKKYNFAITLAVYLGISIKLALSLIINVGRRRE